MDLFATSVTLSIMSTGMEGGIEINIKLMLSMQWWIQKVILKQFFMPGNSMRIDGMIDKDW